MFPMVNEYKGNNNEWKGDVMILNCLVVWWSFQKMASLEGGRFTKIMMSVRQKSESAVSNPMIRNAGFTGQLCPCGPTPITLVQTVCTRPTYRKAKVPK
jgi:hypothetical protein